MTIYCDLDGVLRTHLEDWKAFKYFMSYREYLKRAKPIKENIEYIKSLSDVKIVTCCRHELLNRIWLHVYDIDLPLIITGRNKVEELSQMFEIKGSCLIDDNPEHIIEAEKHGMKGIYVKTNSKISITGL